MKNEAQDLILHRQRQEPSNIDIIGAFAPSPHLDLFYVGNKARDRVYVLASSRHYATIIAMMGGHIRALPNATFWKSTVPKDKGAVAKAIKNGLPGMIWMRNGYAVTRDKVFYDA